MRACRHRQGIPDTWLLQASLEQVEQDFWDIVEGGDESVQVLYGADLDTRGGRSGFPVKKVLRSKSGVCCGGFASSGSQQPLR